MHGVVARRNNFIRADPRSSSRTPTRSSDGLPVATTGWSPNTRRTTRTPCSCRSGPQPRIARRRSTTCARRVARASAPSTSTCSGHSRSARSSRPWRQEERHHHRAHRRAPGGRQPAGARHQRPPSTRHSSLDPDRALQPVRADSPEDPGPHAPPVQRHLRSGFAGLPTRTDHRGVRVRWPRAGPARTG